MLRIAVIGCGGIALSQHGPAYRKYALEHPDTELVACCDLISKRAEDFRQRFGFRQAYTNWQRMLLETQPEAVCLNVPPASTAELTQQILRLGYPLLLEKPPGMNRDEIEAMMRCARETGTPNQVAFNRRYMPLMARLKARLDERFTPNQIQYIHYNFCRVGRTDPDFSTTAIHGIDAVRFLAGADYASVQFSYQPLWGYEQQVVNIYLRCTLQSGAVAQISFCPVSGWVIERAEVYVAGHTFFLNTPIWKGYDFPGELVHVENGVVMDRISGSELSNSSEDFVLNGFYAEDETFFDAIRQGKRPAGDIQSGKQSVEIAQAIRERRETIDLST